MIPYGRQTISEQDIKAVVDVLRSDWLTTGPAVEEFELAFAEFVGAKHAVAVSSGTAALHLAMLCGRIGLGDRVLTSPNTFSATANCAAYVDAIPDFVDVDPRTYNLCPEALERAWQDDVRAVIAVDYAGQPADMPAIAEIARSHGAIVIEDACHAVGGRFWHGGALHKIGGHPWADITTFSFHPVKNITTGEGGMIVTNNDGYANTARLLRSHGIEREPGIATGFVGLGTSALNERGPWYYEMQSLGWNYRITDLQCALGLSQLNQLDGFCKHRRKIVELYNNNFSQFEEILTPQILEPANAEHICWHLYTLQIDFKKLGRSRTQLMQYMRERGVGSQVLYIPVHLQPWYRSKYGYEFGKCPVAEGFYLKALSIPLHPSMTLEDASAVCDILLEGVGLSDQ